MRGDGKESQRGRVGENRRHGGSEVRRDQSGSRKIEVGMEGDGACRLAAGHRASVHAAHVVLHGVAAILCRACGLCRGVMMFRDGATIAATAYACARYQCDGGHLGIKKRQAEQANQRAEPSHCIKVVLSGQPAQNSLFSRPKVSYAWFCATDVTQGKKSVEVLVSMMIGGPDLAGTLLTWRGASGRLGGWHIST